ncbi:MAG: sodium:calcium antiporter, partial [Actinomycetota bacterium]|nr:sodium:calcium antiporter [Actinomycetota bacterium]
DLLVEGAADLIARLGLSQTLIGMTVLALVISVEEVARTVPAAIQGRPEVSLGTVTGSVLAFFLFNAGVIALVGPLDVDAPTLQFYLPVAVGTVVLVSALLLKARLSRWAGGLLIGVYIAFVVIGYVLYGASPAAAP